MLHTYIILVLLLTSIIQFCTCTTFNNWNWPEVPTYKFRDSYKLYYQQETLKKLHVIYSHPSQTSCYVVLLFLQNGSAVIDTSGTLFEESETGKGSVKLILSSTDQALHVNDCFAGTPITAVPKDRSSKWVLKKHKKHAMGSEETQC